MKLIKRNAVLVTVVMFVCAAVYLNWSYNKKVKDASELGDGGGVQTMEPGAGTDAPVGDTEDGGLYYTVNSRDTVTQEGQAGDSEPVSAQANPYAEYFAQVRLERSGARDEAAATLQAVATAQGASQETVDGALKSMSRMAELTVKEAELENMIRAKGFIDCVVYLTEDSASVTVAAEEGLTQTSVAKITDIIVNETELPASKLTVTEIK